MPRAEIPEGVKRFRKRPVEIQAVQVTDRNGAEVESWAGPKAASYDVGMAPGQTHHVKIETPHGKKWARVGYFVIRERNGDLDVLTCEFFEATYEEVTDARAEIPGEFGAFLPDGYPPEVPAHIARYEPSGMRSHRGQFLLVADLPKLHAHWLEQLKEELLTDGALLTICAEVAGLKGGLPEDVSDLRRGLQALLDSIPIEEGGDD